MIIKEKHLASVTIPGLCLDVNFNFDYFECITDDIRYFSNTGDVYPCVGILIVGRGSCPTQLNNWGLKDILTSLAMTSKLLKSEMGHLLILLLMVWS